MLTRGGRRTGRALGLPENNSTLQVRTVKRWQEVPRRIELNAYGCAQKCLSRATSKIGGAA